MKSLSNRSNRTARSNHTARSSRTALSSRTARTSRSSRMSQLTSASKVSRTAKTGTAQNIKQFGGIESQSGGRKTVTLKKAVELLRTYYQNKYNL